MVDSPGGERENVVSVSEGTTIHSAASMWASVPILEILTRTTHTGSSTCAPVEVALDPVVVHGLVVDRAAVLRSDTNAMAH